MTRQGCVGVVCALAVVQLLFLGPTLALVLAVIEHPPTPDDVASVSGIFRYFGHYTYARDIVFAPLIEEIIYRACICSILLCARQSLAFVVFVSPLFFGVSHVHHIIEGKHPLQVRIASLRLTSPHLRLPPPRHHVVVQFCYTYLFGTLSSLFFVRTGSLLACCLTHALCNFFGFPDFVEDFTSRHKKLVVPAYFVGVVAFVFAVVAFATTPFFDQSSILQAL